MSDPPSGRRLFSLRTYVHSTPVPYTPASRSLRREAPPLRDSVGSDLTLAWRRYDSLAARLYANTLFPIVYLRLVGSSFRTMADYSALLKARVSSLGKAIRVKDRYALLLSFRRWEGLTEFFDESHLMMGHFGGVIEEGDEWGSGMDSCEEAGGDEADEEDARNRKLYKAVKTFVRLSAYRDLLRAFRTLKYNDGVGLLGGGLFEDGDGARGEEPYPHEIWSRKRDQDFNFFLPQQVRATKMIYQIMLRNHTEVPPQYYFLFLKRAFNLFKYAMKQSTKYEDLLLVLANNASKALQRDGLQTLKFQLGHTIVPRITDSFEFLALVAICRGAAKLNLRAPFARWKAGAGRSGHMKAFFFKRLTNRRSALMLLGFRRWTEKLGMASRKLTAAKVLVYCVKRYLGIVARAALHHWRDRLERERELLKKILVRFTSAAHFFLSIAFRQLERYISHRNRLEDRDREIVHGLNAAARGMIYRLIGRRTALLGSAWKLWMEVVLAWVTRHQTMMHFFKRFRAKEMIRAWRSWINFVRLSVLQESRAKNVREFDRYHDELAGLRKSAARILYYVGANNDKGRLRRRWSEWRAWCYAEIQEGERKKSAMHDVMRPHLPSPPRT